MSSDKKSLGTLVRRSWMVPLAVVCLLVVGSSAQTNPSQHAQSIDPRAVSESANHDPFVAAAFDHFYNMDYDRATAEFGKVLERHPNDPAAVNHLLSAVLLRELYRMGAMNSGEYTNDSFIGEAHRPADPAAKAQIKDMVARAEGLEERALKVNSNNVDALYARGITRAQFAIYTALIERAWFSALRNAVGARRDHERVLQLDPNYLDAKLVVGTHYYVIGSLNWSVKAAVAMVGLSGTKEKGLEYLRQVAESNCENSVDAKVVLSLFLRREHRYDQARELMHELTDRYPRDYLFPVEEANLLRASGHFSEAADQYRRVWQNGHEGKYDKLHYEVAAWGLGELLRSQRDYAGAASAYELVGEAPAPDPETLQKANLAAGEMYDLLQQRDLAMMKYQSVLAENASSPPAEQARKLIKQAYRE